MLPRFPALVVAASIVVGTAACGAGSLQRGRDLYADGRYVEAAEVFERSEERIEGASIEDRAKYGLYRGATFYALGDLEHAQRWLSLSYDLSRSNPGSLTSEQQGLLARTLRACSERLAALPPPETTTNTKVASSLPAPAATEPALSGDAEPPEQPDSAAH